jgi:hypothetical protein
MANLAEYRFRDYDDRTRVKDKMYYECGGSSSYSDTSGNSDYPYGLYITDECTNAGLAAKICEANGGVRY